MAGKHNAFFISQSVNDIPRPGSAPEDKRNLTVGEGKN